MSDIEQGQPTTGNGVEKVASDDELGSEKWPLEGVSYEQRLYRCVYNGAMEDGRQYYGAPDDINFPLFTKLHRLNIMNLQNKLIECEAALKAGSDAGALAELESTLQRYTTALQNYEYMTKPRQTSNEEGVGAATTLSGWFPEIARLLQSLKDLEYRDFTSSRTAPSSDPIKDWLRRRHWLRRLTWTKAEIERRETDYYCGMDPEELSPFVDRFGRAIIAIVGGATLLVPMIVMSLHPHLTKSLITVSVAVVLFAILLSQLFAAAYSDILTVTTAYAAVLVVFVGGG